MGFGEDVYVVPLFSWYSAEFDKRSRLILSTDCRTWRMMPSYVRFQDYISYTIYIYTIQCFSFEHNTFSCSFEWAWLIGSTFASGPDPNVGFDAQCARPLQWNVCLLTHTHTHI